jgi:hypothetical protein
MRRSMYFKEAENSMNRPKEFVTHSSNARRRPGPDEYARETLRPPPVRVDHPAREPLAQAAAERVSDCDNDLVKSFDIVMPLQPYTEREMTTIAERLACAINMPIESAATELVARLAGGNPGRAKRLLQQLTLSQKRPVTEA